MKLSNIRIEDFSEEGKEKSRLICDVECSFSKEKAVWITVDKKYKDWLCADVYDAFLMAMLYPSMYNNEDIEIDGAVSRKLLVNVNHFIQAVRNTFDSESHIVNVMAKECAIAEKLPETHVGVGFGAGVDSFCSLDDHFFHPIDEENKVDTLCFILVDNYGDPLDETSLQRAQNFYNSTEKVAAELGINACFIDATSKFRFHANTSVYRTEQEARIHLDGLWGRIASVLALQKGLRKFIISSSASYRDSLLYLNQMYSNGVLWMDEWCEGFLLPLCSPVGLDIVSDGAQYPSKNEKLEKIIRMPIVRKHLRACTGFHGTGEGEGDCGMCKKCIRMMIILDIMGELESWKGHFPIDRYKQRRRIVQSDVVRLAHDDNDLSCWSILHLAEKYNYKLPSYFNSKCYYVAGRGYRALRLKKVRKLFR